MPFILVIIGVILLVTAIQGTTTQLGSMLAQDTFGTGGFVYWFVAIIIIGSVGYIKPFKTLSDTGLALVVLVLFLSHGGVFAKFNQQLAQIKSTSSNPSNSSSSTPIVNNASIGQLQGASPTTLYPSQEGTASQGEIPLFIPGP